MPFFLYRLIAFLPFGTFLRDVSFRVWMTILAIILVMFVFWKGRSVIIDYANQKAYQEQMAQRIIQLERESALQQDINNQISGMLNRVQQSQKQYSDKIDKAFGSISHVGKEQSTSPIVTDTIDAIKTTRPDNPANSVISKWRERINLK